MTKIINGVASEFEFPMNTGVFVQNDLIKENQKLKKEHEITKKIARNWEAECTKKRKSTKKFIKYLEDEIKRINPNNLIISELNLRLDDVKFTQYLIYKEILQKYKETIGDYINGFRVEDVYNATDDEVIWIKLSCNSVKIFKNEDIKSIVTKEQFEQMSYKVGV